MGGTPESSTPLTANPGCVQRVVQRPVDLVELHERDPARYPHLLQSTAQGRFDILFAFPAEVIRAVFRGEDHHRLPEGTLHGNHRRAGAGATGGLYRVSMGYLNRDGGMDLNILIRSMVSCGDVIRLRAGTGIVADSLPDAELEETRAKGRGMLRALGIANG